MTRTWFGVLACSMVAVLACTANDAATPEPTSAAPAPEAPPAKPAAAGIAASEAAKVYDERCAVCHGPAGKGDGEAAAGLDPKPNDLTSAEWQRSVTDDQIRTVIVKGGTAIGKAATMPGDPSLGAKPEVVTALVAYVRGLSD